MTVWMTPYGCFDYERRVAVVDGQEVEVPREIISRGFRLAHKHHLYQSAYDYVLKWAAHKLGLI